MCNLGLRRTGIEMGESEKEFVRKHNANNRKKFTSLIVLMKLNERVESVCLLADAIL